MRNGDGVMGDMVMGDMAFASFKRAWHWNSLLVQWLGLGVLIVGAWIKPLFRELGYPASHVASSKQTNKQEYNNKG